MKSLFLLLAAIGASTLNAATIYSNTTTDTGSTLQYSSNGFTGIGDQITLGGSERFATQATTQFFNLLSTAGTFNATLSLYSVGVNPAVVGSLLGRYTVSNIAIGGFDINNPNTSGTTTVTFSGLNVTVPTNLIFVLSVSSVVRANLGLTLFDPPTVGSSNNGFFISATGNTFAVVPGDPGFANVNFSLTATAQQATPEPATLSVVAGGLAGLALLRRRR